MIFACEDEAVHESSVELASHASSASNGPYTFKRRPLVFLPDAEAGVGGTSLGLYGLPLSDGPADHTFRHRQAQEFQNGGPAIDDLEAFQASAALGPRGT